jgi:hypothetical protein
MDTSDWYQRYCVARDYADEQAEQFKSGEPTEGWAYEASVGSGGIRALRATGADWVAYAYEIAARDARVLMRVQGDWWQDTVNECQRLAAQYRALVVKSEKTTKNQ